MKKSFRVTPRFVLGIVVAVAAAYAAVSPLPAPVAASVSRSALAATSVTQKYAVKTIKAVRQDDPNGPVTAADFTSQMDADAAANETVADLDAEGNVIPGTEQTLADRNAYNAGQRDALLAADRRL